MPDTKPDNSRAAGETTTEQRKPATKHGMEEYEEVFRRTDNPYRKVNPHWQNGDAANH